MIHYQPVAWMVYTQDGQSCYVTDNPADVLPNQRALPLYAEPFPTATHPAITHCNNCGCDWLDNGLNPVGCPYCKQPADDEVVFIDGVGAGRSSIKSCRDGVQWIRVGDRVYWPLSGSDAKRLQSACCGNGSFDGPASSLAKESSSDSERKRKLAEFGNRIQRSSCSSDRCCCEVTVGVVGAATKGDEQVMKQYLLPITPADAKEIDWNELTPQEQVSLIRQGYRPPALTIMSNAAYTELEERGAT